jgi:acetylglutamate kinase
VDTDLLETLLGAGYVPVVSPVSLHSVDRPADAPHVINVNGDPVAGEIAAALGAARLVFLTDVAGVTDAEGKVIEKLSAAAAGALVKSGVASGGMIPKINACLRALEAGTTARIIDGRPPHALRDEIAGKGSGTTIYK